MCILKRKYEYVVPIIHLSLHWYNGLDMARRYWKIPSKSRGKKKISHERKAASGEFNFFAKGWGGNFPIPSSNLQAINIVLDWKINKVVKKRVLTNTLFLKNRVLINTLFLKKGYWPIPCFHRRYWEMYWYMDISVLFFNIIQWSS